MSQGKRQKNYWYILVHTSRGPVFVTGYGNGHKEVLFERTEKPMELSKEMAMDIAFGLTVNGWLATAVCSKFEFEAQLYRYSDGEFKWVDKEEEDEIIEEVENNG